MPRCLCSDPRTRGRNRFGDSDEEPEFVPESEKPGGENEDGCWHCKGDIMIIIIIARVTRVPLIVAAWQPG